MTDMGDQTTTFWMTTDIDVGLFEISQRVAEAADAIRMPTAGGAAAGAQQFLRCQGLARAQALPNGRVVRMNIEADGQPTTITLMNYGAGGLARRRVRPAGRLRADADAVDPGRPAQ